jgi:hypothetical protein
MTALMLGGRAADALQELAEQQLDGVRFAAELEEDAPA